MKSPAKIPTCICPACDAIDPEIEYYSPLYDRDPHTGAWESSGYRCMECREVSDVEDWDRAAGHICCECGAIGDHGCPADMEPLWEGVEVEDELERARRRAPMRRPVLPELPANFKFISLPKEA